MAASATIEALGEPRRRQVLDVLRGGEQPVQVLALELGLSQPAVSRHLRMLRDAGLVTVRPDAQRRLYRLRPGPLIEFDEWLESYCQPWRTSPDKLEDHLGPPSQHERTPP